MEFYLQYRLDMARVAIVDDSKDALEVFEIILEGHHQFIPYFDPHEFLREFEPGNFALILIDMAMPTMDGYEVFHRIREQDKDVPVVAITAHAYPEQREKALRAGFCDYFVKPILDIERFREMVYSHIGKCAKPTYESDSPAA